MARAKGLIPERDNPIARWPSARLVPPPFRNRQGGNKGCLRLAPPRSGYPSGGIPMPGVSLDVFQGHGAPGIEHAPPTPRPEPAPDGGRIEIVPWFPTG